MIRSPGTAETDGFIVATAAGPGQAAGSRFLGAVTA
jgi:hypothetical protein